MKNLLNSRFNLSGGDGKLPVWSLVFLTLLYIPVFFILHSVNPYCVVYYGDSNSHAILARSLFDSSEAFNLGTTWLPFYHFLLAPFCYPDAWFFGFASGFILNLFMLFAAFYFLTRLLSQLGMSRNAQIAGLLLFSLNPDFIYLAMAPMTEVTFLALLLGAAYYFYRGMKYSIRKDLLIASLFIALSTLTRYEAWFLAPLPALWVLLEAVKSRSVTKKVIHGLLTASLSFAGILFWLLYHLVVYGGAFRFLQSTKNAGYEPAGKQLLYNVFGVLSAFGSNFVLMFGLLLAMAMLLGCLVIIMSKAMRDNSLWLLLFLAAPIAYLLLSLFFGYVQIKEHWNSRYVLSALPFVVVSATLFLDKMHKAVLNAVLLLSILSYSLEVAGVYPIATYADAKTHIYDRTYEAYTLGRYIADSVHDGKIGYVGGMANASHRIMLFAGVPLKRFEVFRLADSTSDGFTDERVVTPWNYYRLIILENKQAGYGGSEIPVVTAKAAEVAKHARLVQQTTYFSVFLTGN